MFPNPDSKKIAVGLVNLSIVIDVDFVVVPVLYNFLVIFLPSWLKLSVPFSSAIFPVTVRVRFFSLILVSTIHITGQGIATVPLAALFFLTNPSVLDQYPKLTKLCPAYIVPSRTFLNDVLRYVAIWSLISIIHHVSI